MLYYFVKKLLLSPIISSFVVNYIIFAARLLRDEGNLGPRCAVIFRQNVENTKRSPSGATPLFIIYHK